MADVRMSTEGVNIGLLPGNVMGLRAAPFGAKAMTARLITRYFAAMLSLSAFRVAVPDGWFDTRSTTCVAPKLVRLAPVSAASTV